MVEFNLSENPKFFPVSIPDTGSSCASAVWETSRRIHPRINRTRKFHSVSGGIVQPSAVATPSARTSPEFQAVIVQTQFLYICIKDCVWTSLLEMNANEGAARRRSFILLSRFRKWLCSSRLGRIRGCLRETTFCCNNAA